MSGLSQGSDINTETQLPELGYSTSSSFYVICAELKMCEVATTALITQLSVMLNLDAGTILFWFDSHI